MRIRRTTGQGAAISLVAMIDMLMILLVFFMVTSTYLDLNMVSLVGASEPTEASGDGRAAVAGEDAPERLLIRLGSDGLAYVRGQPLEAEALGLMLIARLADAPGLDVIVLPSGGASVQALAGLMDVAVAAGATRLRIVRLDGSP